jgi:hypothetical protein
MVNLARASYEPIRSFNSATFTGVYQAFGDPISHSPFLIKVVNNSDTDVFLSIDGTTDHDGCPAGGSFVYDLSANLSGGIGANIQWYIRGAAGAGYVYLITMYSGR